MYDIEDRIAKKLVEEHEHMKAQISVKVHSKERAVEIKGTPESFLMLSRLFAAQAIVKGVSPFGWNSVIPRNGDRSEYLAEDSTHELHLNLKMVKECEDQNSFTRDDFEKVSERARKIITA